MRTYVSCVALGLAVVAIAPVAYAQMQVAQPYGGAQPYQTYIVQPSGTLMAPTGFVAVPAGVLQPAQLQTVQPVPVIRPVVHHRIMASRTTIHHIAVINSSRPLYDTAAPAVPPPAVVAPAVVTPVIAAPAPGQVLNVSGQFQCIQGCAGGLPGLAFVTQNGWDLNLVNELGQPTRAWVDWPGHIWEIGRAHV